MKTKTAAQLIDEVTARLSTSAVVYGHGTDNAWDEAVALVLGVTGLPDHADSLPEPINPEHEALVRRLLRRRIDERVPLPYLLGRCQFAGFEFFVEPGVVIPRSPIGSLVAGGFRPWLAAPPASIVDFCCGSGCIGIAAALRFPGARLTLVDIDPTALKLAERNVMRHGISDRTELIEADLTRELPAGVFDLVVSNPPYVDASDMRSLPPEYQHEPARGLAAGDDGLDVVRALLREYPRRLPPRGAMICEVGASAGALSRLFPALPFIWLDLEAGGEGVFVLTGTA